MADVNDRYEPVPADDCVVAFGVFADYDGNAPDTYDVVLCSTLELAEAVAKIIGEKYNNQCFVEGYEFSKQWKARETVARRENVLCSIADFEKFVEEEGWEEWHDEDEDGDGEWSDG